MNDMQTGRAGYACSYVPVEVILAAGFSPERIIPGGRCADADGYIHPNVCSYVKSMLSDAMAGRFSPLQAVILANSCDAMRKLFDLWNAHVREPAAFFMDIPKKQDAGAEVFFASVLKGLAEGLSRLPGGRSVNGGNLNEAIRQANKIRSVCMGLFDALKNREDGIRGSDVFALIQEGSRLTPSEFGEKADGFLQTHSGKPSPDNGRNVLVTGNILNRPEPISMIEDAHGSISGIDTCFGMRHYTVMVEEDAPDPFEALARRYLSKPQCPRMMGIREQVDYLIQSIKDTKADCVVVSRVKFCDNLGYTIPLFREAAAAAGAGCLAIENDYEWSDAEKARIKIEAFLEMLG